MNVYEKLNACRLRFQNESVKKSGKNTYAGYTYFELQDILPVVNRICAELKCTCIVKFGEIAELEFIDCEKVEDKIIFTSPMSNATLKGCHEVQNLGAVETYLKRYLYQNCFEIAESDELDATMQPTQRTEKKSLWDKKSLEDFAKIMKENNFTEEEKKSYRELIKENIDPSALKAKAEEAIRQKKAEQEAIAIF